MKVAVIGSGWFGAHVGMCLLRRGIDFTIYEQRERLFEGASGYNQNRLHLGFHYPRSAVTRRQSYEFAQTFMREYPTLTAEVGENIYAVVESESLVDWETYRGTYGNGPKWIERDPSQYGLQGVSGCLQCDERVILTSKAREYFTEQLGAHVRLGEKYEGQGSYEWIINCTYQTWLPGFTDIVYEPCVTLIYETKERTAITLMDGPFYSIYPFEEGTATLYSVKWSRVIENNSSARFAADCLKTPEMVDIDYRRAMMETGVSRWLPDFRDRYKYKGWHGAVRAISRDKSDARVCKVKQDGNVIHVLSGKIDSIFHAEREVLKCLDCS